MQCDAHTGGKTTTHALGLLEPRGTLFTGIQQEVYSGMIIGECARDGEMEVSIVSCHLVSSYYCEVYDGDFECLMIKTFTNLLGMLGF